MMHADELRYSRRLISLTVHQDEAWELRCAGPVTPAQYSQVELDHVGRQQNIRLFPGDLVHRCRGVWCPKPHGLPSMVECDTGVRCKKC